MTAAKRTALLLTLLWITARGDKEKTCTFNNSCILPCHEVNNAEVIHWKQGEKTVHSYYDGQEQLAEQNLRFKSRTSLVEDQRTKRRTSLQLMRVQIQDEGEYLCYTSNVNSGPSKSFMNLQVIAPVVDVKMRKEENRIICSSEGIYPDPGLTWSTDPPSNLTLQGDASVANTTETEDRRYNIRSFMTLSDSDEDRSYSCNISTRSNWRKVTLKQLHLRNQTHVEIPCSTSDVSLGDFSFIWSFNHSRIIVNRSLSNVPQVSDEWKQRVNVSESGHLFLQDLTPDQGGIYTCEINQAGNGLKTENEIWIALRVVKDSPGSVGLIVVVALLLVLLVLSVLIGLIFFRERRRSRTSEASHEMSRRSQQPENAVI
ncbi:uncharacterized protein LOC115394745 [Salarias fasciatus]|uniref:uncharacterized protein LOC115394745 n=1 Tax=Salarias fasciatus TaxID=181472 RepID=UPI001176F3D0|nr:uncharacterized protein LOC115394745 [Salarias fasciatus]